MRGTTHPTGCYGFLCNQFSLETIALIAFSAANNPEYSFPSTETPLLSLTIDLPLKTLMVSPAEMVFDFDGSRLGAFRFPLVPEFGDIAPEGVEALEGCAEEFRWIANFSSLNVDFRMSSIIINGATMNTAKTKAKTNAKSVPPNPPI